MWGGSACRIVTYDIIGEELQQSEQALYECRACQMVVWRLFPMAHNIKIVIFICLHLQMSIECLCATRSEIYQVSGWDFNKHPNTFTQ